VRQPQRPARPLGSRALCGSMNPAPPPPRPRRVSCLPLAGPLGGPEGPAPAVAPHRVGAPRGHAGFLFLCKDEHPPWTRGSTVDTWNEHLARGRATPARLFWATYSAGWAPSEPPHTRCHFVSPELANPIPEEADPAVLPPATVARARELVALCDTNKVCPPPWLAPLI